MTDRSLNFDCAIKSLDKNSQEFSPDKNINLPELIKKDDVVGVRHFLHKNGIPKYSNWDDYNLLIDLLSNEQKEMAKLFIEKGFRTNQSLAYWRNRTPLHIAVQKGYLDVIQMLLAKGASVTAKNNNDETPLILAAVIGNNEITDMILSIVTPDDGANCKGFSHMHIACIRNRIDLVKKFLQNGVDINHPVNLESLHWPGYTPLHFAVHFKCIDTVKFLVNSGADITAKDKNGLTPLHLAFRIQNELILDIILSAHSSHAANPVNSEGLSHFHIACTRNNLRVVKDFVQHGVKVNHRIPHSYSWTGYTALSFAIEYRSINIAKFLIEHNAELGIIKHNNVHTHILQACFAANQVIIDLLLSLQIGKNFSDLRSKYPSSYRFFFKENIFTAINHTIPNENLVDSTIEYDSVDSAQYTILHSAIKHKQDEILVKLLNDTDTNSIRVQDARGKTALHLAFENDKMDIIDKILSFSNAVEENPVDTSGLSHFHICCTRDNATAIKKFVERGVNIDSAVKSDATFWPGFTALHFAVKFQQSQVVKLLLDQGANISVKNGLGLTPLDLAIKCIANECDSALYDEMSYNYFRIIEVILCGVKSRKFTSFDDRGLSLLHIASAKNEESSTKRLANPENINKRIDAKLPIWRGYTPLHMAAHFGSREALQLLIDTGADVSIEDAEGKAAIHLLHYSDYEGFRECDTRLLLTERNSWGFGVSSFHVVCETERIEAVRHFLQLGVEPDQQTALTFEESGKTPLHLALEHHADDVAELLLRTGANVQVRDSCLNTPLHCCLDGKLVEELVARGAHVNALNVYGETPARTVFRQGADSLTVRAFLRNGVDINAEDQQGDTPFTAMYCYHETDDRADILEVMRHVKSLGVLGAPVNSRNQDKYNQFLGKFQENYNYDQVDFANECSEELARMRRLQIARMTTLYDVLFKDSFKMARYCKNLALREILEAAAFETDFPIYGYLVKLQVKKGFEKKPLLNQSKESLAFLTGQWLTSACTDIILEFLTDADLKNLIIAASIGFK